MFDMKVFIKELLLYYMLDVSDPSNPIIFGIAMTSLHAESTDEHWQSAFIKNVGHVLHKILILRELCVYMTPTKSLFSRMKHEQFVNEIRNYQVI
jgi:hypothetical protein